MISKNQIKHIQSLHSKKNREDEGLFIVEGIKLVTEFIQQKKFEDNPRMVVLDIAFAQRYLDAW